MNGMVYPVILENQKVSQLLKRNVLSFTKNNLLEHLYFYLYIFFLYFN